MQPCFPTATMLLIILAVLAGLAQRALRKRLNPLLPLSRDKSTMNIFFNSLIVGNLANRPAHGRAASRVATTRPMQSFLKRNERNVMILALLVFIGICLECGGTMFPGLFLGWADWGSWRLLFTFFIGGQVAYLYFICVYLRSHLAFGSEPAFVAVCVSALLSSIQDFFFPTLPSFEQQDDELPYFIEFIIRWLFVLLLLLPIGECVLLEQETIAARQSMTNQHTRQSAAAREYASTVLQTKTLRVGGLLGGVVCFVLYQISAWMGWFGFLLSCGFYIMMVMMAQRMPLRQDHGDGGLLPL